MARGNGIIVSAEPKGSWTEGYYGVGVTPKPGQIVQVDLSVPMIGGRHTYKLYARTASGDRTAGPAYVTLPDDLRGKDNSTAMAAGDRAFLYSPEAGDELNLLLADVAGTADDHTAGEILMIQNNTGKLIATTGSPQEDVAVLMETVTDPAADTLAWVTWRK
ncbi:MAG: hypothetical protein ACRC7O_04465 [Fimbriiglobus sp.]